MSKTTDKLIDERNNKEELVSCTATVSTCPIYDESLRKNWLISEMLEFVRNVENEKEAIANIKKIMKAYENRKTFWEKFKNFWD